MSRTPHESAQPPRDSTTSYHHAGTFRPAQLVRLATGSSTEPSQDLRQLLRQRLTIIAVIVLSISGVVAAIVTPMHAGRRDWETLTFFWLIVAIPASGLAVVRTRWANSLARLRGVELTVLGLAVALNVFDAHRMLVRSHEAAAFAVLGWVYVDLPPLYRAGEVRMVTVLAGWNSLYWVGLLAGYGLLIPNTRWRATIVVGALAAIHVVVHGAITLSDPDLATRNALWYMLVIVGSMTVAAATVIFGAHRLESLRMEVQAARRIGQYQLMELLGAGGMGEVYRAEHVMLRRPCAIKLIRPERAGDPENLRRFEREVQATATLTNWHTVEIYDFGHAADGTFYYAMEYLPGLTLDQLVGRHGPLPPERAVHLLRQVCIALREAHSIGLIHRDIKPGNIIVGERGGFSDVAKLLDFGLVRAEGRQSDEEKITHTGSLVGTPAYMSPEQAGGAESVDLRTDIYSLGAVAYFLLAGRPPFVGKSTLQVLAAHLRDNIKPFAEIGVSCASDLETVITGCLEKIPDARYSNIDAVDEALAKCQCAGEWSRDRAREWWQQYEQSRMTARTSFNV
jgi:eukaryotic-like serine/threonine-protein kinase